MVLRRTDERRRRVVMDEALQIPEPEPAERTVSDPEPAAKLRRPRQYSKGADRRNHARCSDLIPIHRPAWLLLTLASCAGLFLLTVGGGLATHSHSRLAGLAPVLAWESGLLGKWLASCLFLIAGQYCLVILGIRQHRSNDYRGTYRVWRGFAALCLFASSACLVNWPALGSQVFESISGRRIAAESPWVVAFEIGVVIAVMARFYFEVRPSRGAAISAVVATILLVALLIAQLPLVRSGLESNAALVAGSLLHLSALAILGAVLFAGRFVSLHAAGAIYVPDRLRKKKKKKRKSKSKLRKKQSAAERREERDRENAEAVENDRADRDSELKSNRPVVGSEPAKPRSEIERRTAQSPLYSKMQKTSPSAHANSTKPGNGPSTAPDRSSAEEDDSELQSRLSKAERKRLKRELRANRRAA